MGEIHEIFPALLFKVTVLINYASSQSSPNIPSLIKSTASTMPDRSIFSSSDMSFISSIMPSTALSSTVPTFSSIFLNDSFFQNSTMTSTIQTPQPLSSSPGLLSSNIISSSGMILSTQILSTPLSNSLAYSEGVIVPTPSLYSTPLPNPSQTNSTQILSPSSFDVQSSRFLLFPTPTSVLFPTSSPSYAPVTNRLTSLPLTSQTERKGSIATNLTIIQWFLILVGVAVFFLLLFLFYHFASKGKTYDDKKENFISKDEIEIEKSLPQSPKERWRNSWALEAMAHHIQLPKENAEEMESNCNPVFEEETSHVTNHAQSPSQTKL